MACSAVGQLGRYGSREVGLSCSDVPVQGCFGRGRGTRVCRCSCWGIGSCARRSGAVEHDARRYFRDVLYGSWIGSAGDQPWSGDGTKFTVTSGDSAYSPDGAGFYMVDIPTGARTLVSQQAGFMAPLKLNADGSKLINYANLAAGIAPNIYVKTLPAGTPVLITSEPDGSTARTGAFYGDASDDFTRIGFASASPLCARNLRLHNRDHGRQAEANLCRPGLCQGREFGRPDIAIAVRERRSRGCCVVRHRGCGRRLHALFTSTATNLVTPTPTVSPGATPIYKKDLPAGALTLYGEIPPVPNFGVSGVLSHDRTLFLLWRAALGC